MSSNDTLLTVIVPVFNAGKYLSKCLDSLLKQTYKNLEIILINDGSEDDSEYICLNYRDIDARVHYYYQTNGGVSRARKSGISYSQGEYIAFVDADDYLDSKMYDNLMNAALQYSCDIAECGYYVIDADRDSKEKISESQSVIEGEDGCLKDMVAKSEGKGVLWNKIYRKTLIASDELLEYHFSEDYLWNVIFHSKCRKKIIIPNQLYYHIIHKDNACQSNFNVKRLDSIYALECARDYVECKNHEYASYVTKTILESCMALYPSMKKNGTDDICKTIKTHFNDSYDRREIEKISTRTQQFAFSIFRYSPSIYLRLKKIYHSGRK